MGYSLISIAAKGRFAPFKWQTISNEHCHKLCPRNGEWQTQNVLHRIRNQSQLCSSKQGSKTNLSHLTKCLSVDLLKCSTIAVHVAFVLYLIV